MERGQWRRRKGGLPSWNMAVVPMPKPKGTAATLQSPSEVAQEQLGEDISPVSRASGKVPDFRFAWKAERPKVRIYVDAWAVANSWFG